jgi:hypothetical protein
MVCLRSWDSFESTIIFYALKSLSLRIGLTSSMTNGRPPFSMRTSMSYLPPEWNLVSIFSLGVFG